jgi:nucleotide-binding universal stress UspA family protein
MSPNVIVSYDDTANDRDALALGRVFADAGASAGLAYVRHARSPERAQEVLEERRAVELLERGASTIRAPQSARHVVVHASTGEGLRELAVREGADAIVFGSDYRTAAGTVRPGTSAQRLLHGGPVAVALAPAGLHSRPELRVARIGVLAEGDDDAAEQTARTLATALGARVVGAGEPVDLLVVGSAAGATVGRVTLSAVAEYEIETSSVPVLVVPRGVAVSFPEPALSAA